MSDEECPHCNEHINFYKAWTAADFNSKFQHTCPHCQKKMTVTVTTVPWFKAESDLQLTLENMLVAEVQSLKQELDATRKQRDDLIDREWKFIDKKTGRPL